MRRFSLVHYLLLTGDGEKCGRDKGRIVNSVRMVLELFNRSTSAMPGLLHAVNLKIGGTLIPTSASMPPSAAARPSVVGEGHIKLTQGEYFFLFWDRNDHAPAHQALALVAGHLFRAHEGCASGSGYGSKLVWVVALTSTPLDPHGSGGVYERSGGGGGRA